jgi:hypothetical protein
MRERRKVTVPELRSSAPFRNGKGALCTKSYRYTEDLCHLRVCPDCAHDISPSDGWKVPPLIPWAIRMMSLGNLAQVTGRQSLSESDSDLLDGHAGCP